MGLFHIYQQAFFGESNHYLSDIGLHVNQYVDKEKNFMWHPDRIVMGSPQDIQISSFCRLAIDAFAFGTPGVSLLQLGSELWNQCFGLESMGIDPGFVEIGQGDDKIWPDEDVDGEDGRRRHSGKNCQSSLCPSTSSERAKISHFRAHRSTRLHHVGRI